MKYKKKLYFPQIDVYKRRLKGLTENISISSASLIYNYRNNIIGIRHVVNSSKNKYIIFVYKKNNRFVSKCNCPDFVYRKIICKHIYWIGYKYLDNFNHNSISFNDFIGDIWVKGDLIKYGKNDDCPICLENINYNEQKTLCCYNRCKICIHANCWQEYYRVTENTNCIMCRDNFLPYIQDIAYENVEG